MAAIDQDLLDVLERAEALCENFHRITADQSGERLRHFKQRQCVDSNSRWDGASTSSLDWEECQNEFCQQTLDVESDLEILLPILRPVASAIATLLDGAPQNLAGLRAAILHIYETDNAAESCRDWFERHQQNLRRLQSHDVDAMSCWGCNKHFRNASNFEEHFKSHPKELRHAFPCGGWLGIDDSAA